MNDMRSQFAQQFRDNVEQYRRLTPQRLLRMVYIIFLTALVGSACTVVDRLTGSRTAAMIVGLIGVFFGFIGWIIVRNAFFSNSSDGGEEDVADAHPPGAQSNWTGYAGGSAGSTPLPPGLVTATSPGLQAAPPVLAPFPHKPAKSSSAVWWVMGCLGSMLLLGCIAPIGTIVLLMAVGSRVPRGAAPPVQPAMGGAESMHEQVRAMQQEHQQRLEEMQRQHDAIRRNIEQNHEQLRGDFP